MKDGNIVNLFWAAAQKQPGNSAFIHEKDAITYRQLLEDVQQTAHYYKACGIEHGSKVLVFVPMRIDLYRIVLSLFALGACPVFIDEWVSVDRLNQCCKVVKCDAMIADSRFLFLSYFIKELRGIKIKLPSGKRGSKVVDIEKTQVDPNDTALVTFTTGSTGIPKAANRTHAFLRAQYDALIPYLNDDFNPSLITLPIVVLINLGLGKTTVLPPRHFKTKKPKTIRALKATIKAWNVETIIASPSTLNNFVFEDPAVRNFPIRKIITGGGPVLPDLAAMVSKVFPQAERLAVYGSTEAEPISHLNFDSLLSTTADSIQLSGLPVGETDRAIRIAIIPYQDSPVPKQTNLSWQQMQLPIGMVGEVVVSGPHVLKEYINNEEAQSRNKIDVNGEVWHRTGDAGRIDASGSLYFYGLCKEIIYQANKTYYPLLVSYAIKRYTSAKQVALLLLNDKLTVAIESPNAIKESILRETLEKLNVTDASITYIEKIPTDPRHQTKIDYDKLQVLLRR